MSPTVPTAPLPDQPLVSILLLTWNHEQFIRPCFDSILQDSYKNIEIICMENGSSDGTWAELQRIRTDHPDVAIHLMQNPPGSTLNHGFNRMLDVAKGDLCLLFSGDDLFLNDRIARQVGHFQQNAALQATYSNGVYLGGDHLDGQTVHSAVACRESFQQPAPEVLRFIFANTGLMIQTLMVRTALLRQVGGFDENAMSDDWILNIRIFSQLKTPDQYHFEDFNSFAYRQHGSNAYKKFVRQSSSMIEVIENYYHFPDRTKTLANMYFYQAKVGVIFYKRQHLKLAWHYFIQSQRIRPSLKQMLLFPLYTIYGVFSIGPLLRRVGLRR